MPPTKAAAVQREQEPQAAHACLLNTLTGHLVPNDGHADGGTSVPTVSNLASFNLQVVETPRPVEERPMCVLVPTHERHYVSAARLLLHARRYAEDMSDARIIL
eukprot:4843298-Prymnesium_polylepis.1